MASVSLGFPRQHGQAVCRALPWLDEEGSGAQALRMGATHSAHPRAPCLLPGTQGARSPTVYEGRGCAPELNQEADDDSWLHLPDVEAKFSRSRCACVSRGLIQEGARPLHEMPWPLASRGGVAG